MAPKQRFDDYRRYINWPAGDASERVIEIGGIGSDTRDRLWNLGLLRIGYAEARLQDQVFAWIQIADGGSFIGDAAMPLDVPLQVVAEEPMKVHLVPLQGEQRTANAISLVLSVTPVDSPSDRLYATRTIAAAIAQVIPLPQWVRGVSAITPATFGFRDRAGVALGSAALVGAHDRPAIAADVLVGVAGPIILYY